MAEDDARRIARLEVENDRLRKRYDRLRSRKVVRAGLWLADVLRPGKARRPSTRAGAPSPVGPESPADDGSLPDFDLNLLAQAPPVIVVIPVHNAAAAVRRCLQSVLANTTTAVEIIVFDDASTDPAIAQVLDEVDGRGNLRVVRQRENLGFTRTVNRGMRAVAGDVILLNADTEVPPLWVERLRRAAYSSGDIASSTAISNNAGAFSAPIAGGSPRPTERSVDDVGRAVALPGGHVIETPTANGFCCYLKRSALDDVGLFDEDRFPRGYGEENDWSLRATAAGWRHVVAADVYVLHERGASFGPEREQLMVGGAATLQKLHPGYQRLFDRFVGSRELADLRSTVADALANPASRPRVLTVIHALGGGTEHSTFDLAGALTDHEVFVLKCWPHRWVLMRADGAVEESISFDAPVNISERESNDQRRALARLLVDRNIELVHVRHLMHQSLGNLNAARTLGLPVVVSLHDYYLICPTAHLIDHRNDYCAGCCTPGQGECPADAWVRAGPHLKHGWVKEWQLRTRSLLEGADAVSAASGFTLDLHRMVLEPERSDQWQVIEHGRDLPHGRRLSVAPSDRGPLRVLMAGTIGDHKGNGIVREVMRRLSAGEVEFHVLGTFPGDECPGVVLHGRYERRDFERMVADIRPSVAAILSSTPETWSHTLTEAWASSIPVIAFDHGAPADRIRGQGGGWLIPPNDVDGLVALITDLRHGGADHARKTAEAEGAEWSDTAHMASEYAQLFEEARDRRRTAHG